MLNNGKIKVMKKLFMLAVVLLMVLGACQKEEINPTVPALEEGVGNPDPGDSGEMQLKIASSTIMNATSASQIPSQMFAVNPIYKTAYYHYKQPDNVSCSWTSYVNCINCIVTANNNYCYATNINTVRSRCQNSYPEVHKNGANHISALEWYVWKYDQSHVYYSLKSESNRWSATKEMLAHINNYHTPFVVRSSMGNTGHYRVVFSIDWKKTESASTVYYTDCWYANNGSFNSNIRSMNLYTFLNYMIINAKYYNMLFMWPK